MRLGRKLLVLAGFAVLTAVAMSGGAPTVRGRGRAARPTARRRERPRQFAWEHAVAPSRATFQVEEEPLAKALVRDEQDDRLARLVEALGPISPELALVDVELATQARELLADTPDVRVRGNDHEPLPRQFRVVSTPAQEAEPELPTRYETPSAPLQLPLAKPQRPVPVGTASRRFAWPG